MSLSFVFHNISGAVLPIDDLGFEFALDQQVVWGVFGIDKISESEDLILAVAAGSLEVIETISNTVFDVPQAIRHIATGTGGGIVNDDGILRVHASPRPLDTTTYFTGAGDLTEDGGATWQRGQGERMLFMMKSSEPSKCVDLVFADEVHLKDGFMIVEGAPFGACLDITIVAPPGAVAPVEYGEIPVAKYGNKVPLLKDGWFPMNAQDGGRVPAGMIVRLMIYNATGENDQDPAATFKVAGRIEMFREHTVDPMG